MDKFNFGSFDETEDTELVFAEGSGYGEPSNEEETRRQLSKPLVELRNFVNDTVTVNSTNSQQVLQFGLSNDRTIKYRTGPTDTWKDTQSSGHTILNSEGRAVAQTANLKFVGATVTSNNNVTTVEGLKGDQGEQGPQGERGAPFKIVGKSDTGRFLPSQGNTLGDAYIIGPSEEGDYTVWVWGYDFEGSEIPNNPEWIDIGWYLETPAEGPQGEKGTFQILDLVQSLPSASEHSSEAYAMIDQTDSETHIYISNGTIWQDLGSIRGPAGPQGEDGGGVPAGGAPGTVLIKASTDEYDCEWGTIPVDATYSGSSANAQSGVAVKQAIESLNPVGSVFITYENTDPATQLGFGTWTLIDKEFARTSFTDASTVFTKNTDDERVGEITNFKIERLGRSFSVHMAFKIKTNKSLYTTARELGTFNLANLGVQTGFNETNFIGRNGSSSKSMFAQVTAGGVLKHLSVSSQQNANTVIVYDFTLDLPMANMLPSACDKFYWRRTS